MIILTEQQSCILEESNVDQTVAIHSQFSIIKENL